jgi:hypothetical protein
MFNRYNARGIFLGTTKIATALELGAGRYTFTTRSVIEVLDGQRRPTSEAAVLPPPGTVRMTRRSAGLVPLDSPVPRVLDA